MSNRLKNYRWKNQLVQNLHSFNITIAFTLIELLVVIAIIGILSGLIVVSMGGITQRASIAKAQVFSNSLKNSLMLNLVSEWKFDQILGLSAPYTIIDSWSGGNTGTLTDASGACSFTGTLKCPQLSTSDCPYGNCLSFDGINDYISIADSPSLNMGIGDFTLALWINLLDQPIADNSRLVFKIATSPVLEGYNFAINGNNGFLGGYIAENGISKTVNANKTNVENTGWHYAVFSIDRDSSLGLKIYVDGSQETYGTQENPITIPGDITAAVPLIIGRNNVGPANTYINGKIDDLRIYNTIIPTSQIEEHYYAGLNNLLTKGEITKEEYLSKISNLAKE